MADQSSTSPPWPRNVKTIIAVAFLLLMALAFWRFFDFVELVILAALLAFLLNPIVNALRRWVRLPHGIAILVAYLFAVIVLGLVALMVGASMQNQLGGLIENILDSVRGLTAFVERMLVYLSTATIQVGNLRIRMPSSTTINEVMPQFYESLVGQASGFIGQGGSLVTGVAQTALVTLSRTIVMIVLSIYFLLDSERLFAFLHHAANQVGYGRDAALLMTAFVNIWKTYFRGQVLLALTMGVLVSVTLFALRVDNPVALGVIAGLLELVPVLGQYITMAITVVLVFFQPEPPGAMQPWLYTLLVAGVLFGIQQIQGNIILPRIHGRTLAVHPVLILLGVLIGATFAGVLGAILAPPLLATLNLFGAYIWRKMLDLPPFDEETAEANR